MIDALLKSPFKLPKYQRTLSIFVRIWFFFSVILVCTLLYMMYNVNQQFKPNVRQVVEDTLAENVNIIAQLIAEDVYQNKVQSAEFHQKIQNALSRDLQAQIWHVSKNQIQQQLYITDAQGVVLYNSTGQDIDKDYSKWNDVYLTLRGQYGVRSSRQNPDDELSSVMYVAAPVIFQQKVIGVVSVSKPNQSVQPYLERAKNYLYQQVLWVALFSLALSSIVAFWLKHSIEKVRRYAQALAPVSQAPYFYSANELNQVTQAISQMRETLQDHAYVEEYINTLTHELKSPLTSIQASAELLQDELPYQDQRHFAELIEQQSIRLKQLIERMLLLTRLEKTDKNLNLQPVNLSEILKSLILQHCSRMQQKNIQLQSNIENNIYINTDLFWLSQAILNILDNAIDFADENGILKITLNQQQNQIELTIFNQGQPIPDFALAQIFQRYFSLPRPNTQQRSSGIGLTLVKQVMDNLGAEILVENQQQPLIGVKVLMIFAMD
ncbi:MULTISPECIES: two-component system sensor histidine kinase CreC [unclassified Acinetobacter]|uniref:two-component system sensor histidine kinase CreC n=1 Tax=unclassified Acinetobacter TaxID=196816 RepID=UPI0035B8DBC8